jgi:CTP:molybdopterin cytidylyltransferase MocA
MNKSRVFPILLAAGSAGRLGFPKPLARFGEKTALEIAVANCAGLAPPVVVLGSDANLVRPAVPRGLRVVIHQRWRRGQLSSLLAGLRKVPRDAAFLIYPVDHPLLTRAIVQRLVRAFERRKPRYAIVMPIFGRRPGHPVICEAEIRRELRRGDTAREVVYREPRRILKVRMKTAAVCRDFDSPATYFECLRSFPARRA